MISPSDRWLSPAQIAHRLLLPDLLRPFADAFIAAMPGDVWTFAFASGHGARVTCVDDDAWCLDVVVKVLGATEDYPFLPRSQPISAALLDVGLTMLRETPSVSCLRDDSDEIIRSISELEPFQEHMQYLFRVRWLPVYAELMFKFGNHGIFVRWAPANASIGLHTDVVTAEIRRIHVGFYNRLTVGELLQDVAVASVAEAADLLGVIERRGVDFVVTQEGGQQ
jgi:hypothetical protein